MATLQEVFVVTWDCGLVLREKELVMFWCFQPSASRSYQFPQDPDPPDSKDMFNTLQRHYNLYCHSPFFKADNDLLSGLHHFVPTSIWKQFFMAHGVNKTKFIHMNILLICFHFLTDCKEKVNVSTDWHVTHSWPPSSRDHSLQKMFVSYMCLWVTTSHVCEERDTWKRFHHKHLQTNKAWRW